jgi:glycosyltransferase involved in cell wall biosynthesis
MSVSPYPRLSVVIVTKYDRNLAGGLGRYEDGLLRELENCVDVEQRPSQAWPLPGVLIRAAELVGRDLAAVLHGNRSFVPGPRDNRIFHLTNQELAVSLRWQRYHGPTVVTVHDVITVVARHEHWEGQHDDRAMRFWQWQWTRGLRRADRLIAVSQWTKDDIVRSLGISPDRIRVVHQAVDPEVFRPGTADDTTVLARAGLPHGAPYVLYVGSLLPRKDVPTLIRALASVRRLRPEVCLVLAGPPRIEDTAPSVILVRQEIERLGVSPAVIVASDLSDTDLAALYRGATVTVLPSQYEGFGFPIIEAMACGSPVIAAATSCLPEVVGDAGLLFPFGEPGALAAQIERILANSTFADNLRSMGLERASRFSPQRRAAETMAVYEDIAQGSGAGR